VMYAPMLSIIFVAGRMRALQLSQASDGSIPSTAGPPVWVQECMFLSTWSVLVQLILVIVLSCLYTVEMDVDGNVKTPADTGKVTGYVLNGLRYFSMIAMYGGSCAILYGTYYLNPENCQPYSYEGLHPAIAIPAPGGLDEALGKAADIAPTPGAF